MVDYNDIFKELYKVYYDKLFKFAIHFVKSEVISEEVVSDVFFNLWINRTKLSNIKNLEAYLYKATKNTSLHYLEKKLNGPHLDINSFTEEILIELNNPEEVVIQKELQLIVRKEIEGLPERCRLIFKMVREDRMKYKQIAEILDISVRTIDAQMAIAVKRIGEAIQKYFEN